MDADPRRERRTSGFLVELRDSVKNCQASPCGALRVVVVRLGPAKERHHAVTEVLRDMPTEASNRLSGRTMIAGHYFAPILRVQLRGNPGRTNQIAKQNRQMPPLAGYG